jgi:saccharopine dehydrogenase (NAD+, L-lysine-forming)
MAVKTLVLLGGYGNTGRALGRLLLEHTETRLVLAGRNPQKARAEAASWNERFPGERCRGMAADASDLESLRRVFEEADLVIVASSTSASAGTVAEAALEARADYMDPQYSRSKLAVLRGLIPRIEAAGRCFITDAGFHPGLPAALIRFAARHFDHLRSARVGSVIQIDWNTLTFSDATLEELVNEFRDYQPQHYKGGRWHSMTFLESFSPVWMTFGHGFGRRYTMPMFLEELRPLPDLIPGIEEAGFFVGGFNWVVDWVIMPIGMGMLWLRPQSGGRPFGRMMAWGLRRFSKPPYGTMLQLEACGTRGATDSTLTVSLYHDDGYVLTAAPMVACLLQLLDGSARRPGLHFQALLPDPARLLEDMQRMGIEVMVTEGEAAGRTI